MTTAEDLWDFVEWCQQNKGGTPEQYLAQRDDTILAARARWLLDHPEADINDVLSGGEDHLVFSEEQSESTEAGTVVRVTGE